MFSRWMLPAERRTVNYKAVLAILLTLAACSVWYLALHPWGILVGGIGVGIVTLGTAWLNFRLAQRAKERPGEDIGSFARAFNRRDPSFDPWILRAVWDALEPWTALRAGGRFPLRPTDSIAGLGCVGTDFDEVVLQVLTRARRTREQAESNPYFDQVTTVADLVNFVAHQPRAAAA